MSSSSAPQNDRAADLRATRQLIDDLRRSLNESLDGLTAQVDALLGRTGPAAPTYHRPSSVPPRRMEQMVRTPEPTADLDDLAPRLLERLVPALRDALRDDS